MPRRRTTAPTALLLMELLLASTALVRPARADRTPDDGPRSLAFDVYLDERPIGYQRFDLTPLPDGLAVETRARFELTLLRIKALDYDHRNRERWHHGCLQSIDSATRQNGRTYRVSGEAGRAGFSVEGADGRATLDACVRTFAYWDRSALLGRARLLNAQTGEYVPVETRALGRGTLEIGGRALAVDRYLIEGDDLEIRLAYASGSGEWVGLDSPLFAGRTLRYRRRASDLPPTPSAAEATAAAAGTTGAPSTGSD
ncbi:MAG: DUF6134 family protein [Myxococcota bacterium]